MTTVTCRHSDREAIDQLGGGWGKGVRPTDSAIHGMDARLQAEPVALLLGAGLIVRSASGHARWFNNGAVATPNIDSIAPRVRAFSGLSNFWQTPADKLYQRGSKERDTAAAAFPRIGSLEVGRICTAANRICTAANDLRILIVRSLTGHPDMLRMRNTCPGTAVAAKTHRRRRIDHVERQVG